MHQLCNHKTHHPTKLATTTREAVHSVKLTDKAASETVNQHATICFITGAALDFVQDRMRCHCMALGPWPWQYITTSTGPKPRSKSFLLLAPHDANKRTGNKQRHISNCKPKHVDQTNPRTHEADRIGMAFRFVCLDACLFLRLVSLLDLFLFVRSFGLQRETLGTTNASRLHKQKQARTQTNRPGNKQK
jgi:hypothetical protein